MTLCKLACELCWKRDFVNTKGHPFSDDRKSHFAFRRRFWEAGFVHCSPFMDEESGFPKEHEEIKIRLWAGHPLPKLHKPEMSWAKTIEGRSIHEPPPSYCPFAVEHIVSQ
jgi:hypothetical protein